MKTKQKCEKCDGAGKYAYDENHIKTCEACCLHDGGWWKMEKHYGRDNGKYACKKGCGTIIDDLPSRDSTEENTSAPQTEEDLMELTKAALADVLGREPTKSEILKAHAGFKRMAFVMYEHARRAKKE